MVAATKRRSFDDRLLFATTVDGMGDDCLLLATVDGVVYSLTAGREDRVLVDVDGCCSADLRGDLV